MEAADYLRDTVIQTPAGSQVAVYVAGEAGPHFFILGGWAGRSIKNTPLAQILAEFVMTRGMSCTFVDLPGTTNLQWIREPITMDLWLDDISYIYRARGIVKSIWIGASLGAWPMLLLNQRQPGWFAAMCALAPAIDWDTNYLLPGIAAGKLKEAGDLIFFEDSQALPFPRSLLASMSRFQLSDHPWQISAPLHIIHGCLDDVASSEISERLKSNLQGAPCSLDMLPGESHRVGKLTDQASQSCFANWLNSISPNPAIGSVEAVT